MAGETKILVLDEANAQLDQQAEKGLVNALYRLKGHLTVIIVTHRPSMLAVADRQYKLADGRIEEISDGIDTGARNAGISA